MDKEAELANILYREIRIELIRERLGDETPDDIEQWSNEKLQYEVFDREILEAIKELSTKQ